MAFYNSVQHPLVRAGRTVSASSRGDHGNHKDSNTQAFPAQNFYDRQVQDNPDNGVGVNYDDDDDVASQSRTHQNQKRQELQASSSELSPRLRRRWSVFSANTGSSFVLADEEWVLFSASIGHAGGSGSSILQDQDDDEGEQEDQVDDYQDKVHDYDDDDDDYYEDDDDDYGGQMNNHIDDDGRQNAYRDSQGILQLSFPRFDQPTGFIPAPFLTPTSTTPPPPPLVTTPISSGDDLNTRVNAWRLDQSEQLHRELQRRLRPRTDHCQSLRISSWGIPVEEEIDDTLTTMTATTSAGDEFNQMLPVHVRDDYFMTDEDSDGVVSLASLQEESQARHDLIEARKRARTRTQLLKTSSDLTSPQNRHHHQQQQEQQGHHKPIKFWERLTHKVMHDIIGLESDVIGVLFGDRFTDASLSSVENHDADTHATTTPSAYEAAGYYASNHGQHENHHYQQQQQAGSLFSAGRSDKSSINSRLFWEERLIAKLGQDLALIYHRDYGSIDVCHGLFV
ncbi:hypothetical protein V1514DRAFT_334407 [Lipomyces japonicus]|uniref:uncharacterized protein n=1 Tax=Lipomyces japonicus TaxID=56871 RepID=UPI0034CE3A5B